MKNIRIGHLFFGSFLIGGGLLLTSAISSCSDAKSIKISKNSDLRKYLIDELTPIYTNKNQTENSAYKCGHKLLDLNKLSNDHNNYSNFNIVTDVDFGFLIDPNESAHIYSSNHSKIIISSNNKHATGFVIGSAIIVDQDYGYNGKLVIDSNISLFAKSFSPEMDASWACGLYAGDLNVSLIDIGATFNIYANDYTAYGVRIGGIANPNSVQKFSGVFIIKAIYHEAAGIVLASSVDSRLETNGIFDIEAIANDQIGNVNAYGV